MHKSLKNEYILGFLHSEVVDKDKEREGWVPGLYMLLELAVGGDLFDKIGESRLLDGFITQRPVPDIGVPEDLAKFYFAQLASGMASGTIGW